MHPFDVFMFIAVANKLFSNSVWATRQRYREQLYFFSHLCRRIHVHPPQPQISHQHVIVMCDVGIWTAPVMGHVHFHAMGSAKNSWVQWGLFDRVIEVVPVRFPLQAYLQIRKLFSGPLCLMFTTPFMKWPMPPHFQLFLMSMLVVLLLLESLQSL